MTGRYTMLDVFEEVDDLVYTFPNDVALEAWALHGDETFVAVRPAKAEDRITDEALHAWMDGTLR